MVLRMGFKPTLFRLRVGSTISYTNEAYVVHSEGIEPILIPRLKVECHTLRPRVHIWWLGWRSNPLLWFFRPSLYHISYPTMF